jgi:cytochrome c oxidase cbb3-type subunit 3
VKVQRRLFRRAAAALALATLYSCDRLPGQPSISARPLNPKQVTDFARLYGENCAGCHGQHGRFGGALALNNRVYLAIVDDVSLRNAIANGLSGTSMPAFAVKSGGMLTEEQVVRIVNGIRYSWGGEQGKVDGAPPYQSEKAGDPASGAKVFGGYCASCHGTSGTGGAAGAIADPSFLALYNDQALRTLIIAGRPDLGHPGWNGYVGKPPLSSGQISDLVAWLAARREP